MSCVKWYLSAATGSQFINKLIRLKDQPWFVKRGRGWKYANLQQLQRLSNGNVHCRWFIKPGLSCITNIISQSLQARTCLVSTHLMVIIPAKVVYATRFLQKQVLICLWFLLQMMDVWKMRAREVGVNEWIYHHVQWITIINSVPLATAYSMLLS